MINSSSNSTGVVSETTNAISTSEFIEIQEMAKHSQQKFSKDELKAIACKLVSQELDPIMDSRYRQRGAEKLFRNQDVYTYLADIPVSKSKTTQFSRHEMSTQMGQLPLLSPENEAKFFSQMNYLKFRFNQLRSKIDLENPNRKLVLDAQDILKQIGDIRDLLIRSNLRLVISVTRKFVTTQMPFDDLFSDGVMALMQAVEKFDVSLGYRFSTYAYYSISRSMYRFTKRLKKRMMNVESLESNSEDSTSTSSPWGVSEWSQLSSHIEKMIGNLNERERWIIQQRYVFVGSGKAPTYRELAEKLGVCNERVRQLEKRALRKLREMEFHNDLDDLLESSLR